MQKVSAKSLLAAGVAAGGAVAAVHLLSALTLDRRLEYRREVCASPRLSRNLNGYTVAWLTDIHQTPPRDLREMVKELNRRRVDLVLLGGDLPRGKGLSECLDILSGIHCADGFYGVEGNHDSAPELSPGMERRGMTLLENEGLPIREGLYLAGVEDLRNRAPNVPKAVRGAGRGDFVLLLAHNPDITMLQDMTGVDLTLCGHTHGGEAALFGLWAPALYLTSGYGQRFRSGWCKSRDNTPVYVSHGIGRHLPVRFFARPRAVLLELRRTGKTGRSRS